jgi:hypothetical protein
MGRFRLCQRGTLTLTGLATHIRVDRRTLAEMISCMSDKGMSLTGR